MFKKCKIGLLIFACILLIGAGQVEAEEISVAESNVITRDHGIENIIGFDMPTYGWAQFDDQDRLIGWEGFNLGIGYSQKNYFDPLEFDKFNPFWEWGTVLFIIPYVGIGGEYPIEVENDGYVSFSGAVGLYTARIGVSYAW